MLFVVHAHGERFFLWLKALVRVVVPQVKSWGLLVKGTSGN